jgi:hypothetical protein
MSAEGYSVIFALPSSHCQPWLLSLRAYFEIPRVLQHLTLAILECSAMDETAAINDSSALHNIPCGSQRESRDISLSRDVSPTSLHSDQDGPTRTSPPSETTDSQRSHHGTIIPRHEKHRWRRVCDSDGWSLEVICVLISLASIVSLLVVFLCFRGRSLGDWQFYFTLNTVVSVLGTVAKSTLLLAVAACIGQSKWEW